jgi:hypothetical protein
MILYENLEGTEQEVPPLDRNRLRLVHDIEHNVYETTRFQPSIGPVPQARPIGEL